MGIAKQERDYQGLQVCHVRHRDHMQITQKKLEVPSLVSLSGDPVTHRSKNIPPQGSPQKVLHGAPERSMAHQKLVDQPRQTRDEWTSLVGISEGNFFMTYPLRGILKGISS